MSTRWFGAHGSICTLAGALVDRGSLRAASLRRNRRWQGPQIEAGPCRCPLRLGRCESRHIAQTRASPNASARWRSTRTSLSAHAWIGFAKNLTGRNEETEAHILEALRISPHDTRACFWMMIAGVAKLWAGHYEGAVAWLSRSIEQTRTSRCVTSACGCVRAPRTYGGSARSGAQGLELNPGFTIARDRVLEAQRQSRLYRRPRAHVRGHAPGRGPEQ